MKNSIEDLYNKIIAEGCNEVDTATPLDDLYEHVQVEQQLDENGKQQLDGIYESMLMQELYLSHTAEEPVVESIEESKEEETITFTEFYKNKYE